MSLNENAAMPYHPADDEPTGTAAAIQVALAKAEKQLSHRKGVMGMGMTKTPSGRDAIVVYVDQQQTISQLPAEVDGFPIVGDVTGEIRAF
ncbi:hypothetical protein Enr13x_57880 [Stieleria neptunia]|uniref:Uncharacterized protein n=1 Tax=Stieleria neptunia TaxID=2527979 RepID=A0A518HYF6_9BACT|nr:hypothetical protein [Stieleria neptunia]QDV45885.1 hypothetical protein Enr13x_57880 [Stieleria neptunia]